MTIHVNSSFVLGSKVHSYTQAEIKAEPMLWNCDIDHAYKYGGDITKEFINNLPLDYSSGPVIFDSRTHMLMPGWFPCIPGWHHDDVPRTRTDGQPNYSDPMRSHHAMMLCNADICPTEFLTIDTLFKAPPIGTTIYEEWDSQIDNMIHTSPWIKKQITQCPDNQILLFTDRTWHRGTAAVASGWRFFIRASIHYDSQPDSPRNQLLTWRRKERGDGFKNEIRTQVQVYLETLNKGW